MPTKDYWMIKEPEVITKGGGEMAIFTMIVASFVGIA